MIGEQSVPEKQSNVSQILLLGMVEVMGEEAVNTLLQLCGLPRLQSGPIPHQLDNPLNENDYRRIQTALRSQYGPLSARGLALRSGRESFKYGLREYGQKTGLLDLKFRLLPTRVKLKTGLYAIANLVEETGSIQAQIEENEHLYIWHMDPACPLCWTEPSGEVTCPTLTGLLQEFFYWASGGKLYRVNNAKVIGNELAGARSRSDCELWIDKLAFE